MSEHEAYGMPSKKLIDGKRYEYNEPANSKSDAERLAKNIRKELGFSARVVSQMYHGYKKYHIYFRPRAG